MHLVNTSAIDETIFREYCQAHENRNDFHIALIGNFLYSYKVPGCFKVRKGIMPEEDAKKIQQSPLEKTSPPGKKESDASKRMGGDPTTDAPAPLMKEDKVEGKKDFSTDSHEDNKQDNKEANKTTKED